MHNQLLQATSGWISAQEVFRRCGVGAGTDTDAIERLYEELRAHVASGQIVVNRRGEADWLRLSEHRRV